MTQAKELVKRLKEQQVRAYIYCTFEICKINVLSKFNSNSGYYWEEGSTQPTPYHLDWSVPYANLKILTPFHADSKTFFCTLFIFQTIQANHLGKMCTSFRSNQAKCIHLFRAIQFENHITNGGTCVCVLSFQDSTLSLQDKLFHDH